MAWLAVDKDGAEWIFETKPIRNVNVFYLFGDDSENLLELPNGTIEKIIGRKITWEDEPVEI